VGELLSVRELAVTLRRAERRLVAVEDVCFDIAAGEALGLVGESGCGKSLTASSLFRLLPDPPVEVRARSIRFLGQELSQLSEAHLAALRGDKVGMIFQDPTTHLNPVLTVGGQIGEPLRFHRGLGKAAARERVLELMHEVGIPAPERRVDAYPHELSGGLRQRVLIAAALACDPALLIADEPTTALDVTLQAQILRLIDRERRERGMGLLFITHDLSLVAALCERVAVMYAGRIVEIGPTAQIFERPSHPYTAGLLAAVRALDQGRVAKQRLPALPGTVPALEQFEPIGCRFRDRCQRADPLCGELTPLLLEEQLAGAVGPASEASSRACHHPLQ